MVESTKFTLKEITVEERWKELLLSIYEPTIFDSSNYQTATGEPLIRLCVYKGNQPYSLFYAPVGEEEIIDSDFYVHSGTRPLKQEISKKTSTINSELFSVNDIICSYISERYSDILFRMHPNIIDLRPYLWKNYGSNKKRFKVNINYTLMIDISEMFLKRYESGGLFSNFDRNIKRDLKKGVGDKAEIIFNSEINLLADLYKKTFSRNGKVPTDDKISKIINISQKLIRSKEGLLSILKRNNIPLYFAVFSVFDNKACHLYGGGNHELVERQDCTVLLWESFKKLSEMGVHTVDLEGINSPKRGNYKLGFGGNIVPYYELSWKRE